MLHCAGFVHSLDSQQWGGGNCIKSRSALIVISFRMACVGFTSRNFQDLVSTGEEFSWGERNSLDVFVPVIKSGPSSKFETANHSAREA